MNARVAALVALLAAPFCSASAFGTDAIVEPVDFTLGASAGYRVQGDGAFQMRVRGESGEEASAEERVGITLGTGGGGYEVQTETAGQLRFLGRDTDEGVTRTNRIGVEASIGVRGSREEQADETSTPEGVGVVDIGARFRFDQPVRVRVTGAIDARAGVEAGDPRVVLGGHVIVRDGSQRLRETIRVSGDQAQKNIWLITALFPSSAGAKQTGTLEVHLDSFTSSGEGESKFEGVVEASLLLEFTTFCAADLDASGEATIEDFEAFVAAYADESDAADLDGSGTIDTRDMDVFMESFRNGCG